MQQFYKNKKILITGSSGFVGSWLAVTLQQMGANIYGISLEPNTSPSIFKLLNLEAKIKQKYIDICDYNKLSLAINEISPNIVFHLAAQPLVRESYIKTIDTFQTNVIGTLNTLETCKINKIRNYLFSSWAYVYSNSGSFYKSSKQAAECIIQEYCKNFKINFKILRYGSLYGEGSQDWNGIKKYLIESLKNKKILYPGSGKEIRQLIHIFDACKLSVDIMQNSKFNNKSITITGNKSIKSKVILSKIFKASGLTEKIVYKNLKNSLHYSKSPYTYKPIKEIIIKPKKDMNFELGLKNILKEIT